MINIVEKVDCCGCNACGDICPKNAISFKPDNEGFLYPLVDIDKCVDCGLCVKVCPIINVDTLKVDKFEEPKCYAAQNKNLESLFNSTSGSAFAAFAEKIYKDGGYVGGAVFDENYSVIQLISSNKKDLEILRNTKYVQSDSQGFYIKVKELLKAGEKVLVCGLPCQMAGLRAFLGRDYDNLIVIDMICLGINSPLILPAYLNYKERQHKSKVVYYKAKNKELGWRQLTTKLVFENGDVEYDKRDTNYFTQGFIGTHAFARPSCYNCKFKGFPRLADITIGDFWGVERYAGKDLDSDLGTSVVLLNTNKGEKFYDTVRSKFKDKKVLLNDILTDNKALLKSLSLPNIDRQKFYSDLSKLPFEEFAHKYIKLPSQNRTVKSKLKNLLKFLILISKASRFNFKTWFQNIYYNIICNNFKTCILDGQFIIIYKHCILSIDKTAKVNINGILHFGPKKIVRSKLESRFIVEKNSIVNIGSGYISYGADIEVFSNSILNIGKNVVFNISSTIICGDKIEIGDDVCFGRNVTVRDNNGGHYMSRKIYKNARPVSIGQHSWITEQCLIMPGAKIGVGVVVGAGSIVSSKLPNFTLATGRPAEIVDEDIYWKA